MTVRCAKCKRALLGGDVGRLGYYLLPVRCDAQHCKYVALAHYFHPTDKDAVCFECVYAVLGVIVRARAHRRKQRALRAGGKK